MASSSRPEQKNLLPFPTSRAPSPSPSPQPQIKYVKRSGQKRDYIRRIWRTFLKQSRLGAVWALFWIDHEDAKIIVDRGRALVLSRSLFHLLALSMTIALSWLQIAGFYIGGTLEGWHSPDSESAKLLLLQIAAKVLELIVITSLTTVVVEIVRSFLLDSSIPFGWIAAHLQFSDPLWFVSEGFWAALKGFKNKTRFAAVALFLVVCGAIALLTGPATAVLLIPAWRTDWYAGGTDYFLSSTPADIWPTRLTINAIGGLDCQNVSSDAIKAPLVSQSGCIWAGYPGLRADNFDAHQSQVFNVTLNDGLQSRLLQRFLRYIPEVITIAPQAAVILPTNNFSIGWTNAISSLRGISSKAHYQRNIGGSTFRVKSAVPFVRANCFEYVNFTVPDNFMLYPYLPETGSAQGICYRLPNQTILDSTLPAAQWIIPNASYPLSNGTESVPSPSAFVNLQISAAGSRWANFSAIMACSVDARWINTTNVGTGFDATSQRSYSVHAEPPEAYINPPPGIQFPATEEQVKASFDKDWLDALSPLVEAGDVQNFNTSTYPGYNTLADILHAMTLDDGHTALFAIIDQISSVVATVVADGMSRVGYRANGGDIELAGWQHQVVDRYNMDFAPGSRWGKDVYKGTASTTFPDGYDASNTTKQRLDIYIQGYSFKADSTAYWLSLVLFFVHAIIVISHLVYRLFLRKDSSVAWESVTDLMALALTSEPPQGEGQGALHNTCGGVDSFQTLSAPIAARVPEPDANRLYVASEQVQLFMGGDIKKRSLSKVEPGLTTSKENVKRCVRHRAKAY
ncbi:hypothetical protein NA57DRAFT_73861 [Rhizodiscina lignyota]|uniref:Uncharacterized protein n=1 Tax=Rhizodiscina lignyota TaxID=1504668 RepID=A0A9P4IEC4_9PEZI|nr:hypothetical protein NA57DRAFT_73861 [Rhizodiscina lignyota]